MSFKATVPCRKTQRVIPVTEANYHHEDELCQGCAANHICAMYRVNISVNSNHPEVPDLSLDKEFKSYDIHEEGGRRDKKIIYPNTRQCDFCGRTILDKLVLCPYCGK